ncbi:hypothetical protein V3W47_18955 [Deinococcus sp. YIM 134068]|uniref:hypothetical protein n=1 Tax=Deinococcus lichenicola TaxID=3118910 RepID=UPI002F954C65
MIPAAQLILSLAVTLFGSKILGLLNLTPPSSSASSEGRVYVMADHPAATATNSTTTATTPTTGTTSGTTSGTTATSPTVKEIAADVARQPWSIWGVAALCLAAPLLIAQVRAGGHEVAGGLRSVYDEGQNVYRRVDRADDYVGNRSRRNRRA